jgi:ubiquinone/menaquinone biosynthesis C-methylase UbiE
MAASPNGSFAGGLPDVYERYLVSPLFRPFAVDLLRRVQIDKAGSLLDVACGTGIAGRAAREIAGDRLRVVGVDLSAAMLAKARSVAPSIEWREGDAARLPVVDGEIFDVVICHQGLQFLADKRSALREMRRALASNGRVGVATWLGVDALPLMRDLQRVAERHVGPFVDARHGFGDPHAVERLLVDGGFRVALVETITHTVRLEGGIEVFPRLNAMAIVSMLEAATSMSQAARARLGDAIARDSADAARAYVDGDELVFDLASIVAVGVA